MYKKIITLLFALIWCFNLSAQDYAEVSPILGPVNYDPQLAAIWDVEFNYDATVITGAAGNAGAVYIPTLDKFWTSRWASNVAHQWNSNGTLDMQFTLPFTGTRGMCFDGQFLYHSINTTTVQIVDPVTRLSVGTIPVVGAPNGARFITYNPDGNAGAGSIIVGNWIAPNHNFYEFSMTGTLLRTITNAVTGVYGLAYDNLSTGGPFLWVWSQGAGAGTPQLIQQMDYTAGTYTGVTHDVISDVGVGQTGAIAGGLFITDQLVPGFVTLGGMLQGVPDRLFGYELAPSSGGAAEFFDDFEAYTAGTQLCLQTTNWEPWVGSLPGSSADPFVSSAQSFSGNNSVVIVSGNDLVRRHGPKTSGKWYISFVFYIPTGKSGYFNTMNGYDPGTNVWGMDSYFNVGGIGNIDTTGGGSPTLGVAFNWIQNAWNQVVVVVDLDATPPKAEYWLGTNPSNFTQIATWGWTQNGTKPNELHINDIYGAATTDEMYVDDFYFDDTMPLIIPVELTSFTAIANNGVVELNWATATETNNQMFEIQRQSSGSDFATIGFVNGHGTTTETQEYTYVDRTVSTGIYSYRLKQIDFDGSYEYSPVVEVDVRTPLTFALDQNYPNPFNPSTSIKYSVPETGNVRLAVFNLIGEEVAVLVNGTVQAGRYELSFNASSLPSGVYLYKLQSANSVEVKKMMLLK